MIYGLSEIKMSDESDEFFDATEITQSQQCSKNELVKKQSFVRQNEMSTKEPDEMDDRRKFSELRRRIQSEDDDVLTIVPSTPASRTSSIDSDVPVSKNIHPFRVIEQHDDTFSAKSLNSLISGRNIATKISTASTTVSFTQMTVTSINTQTAVAAQTVSSTIANVPIHSAPEPDVIASAKKSFVLNNQVAVQSKSNDSSEAIVTAPASAKPVPPPRFKRKPKLPSTAATFTQTPVHTSSNKYQSEKQQPKQKPEPIKIHYDDCIKNRIDQLKLELLNTKSNCGKNELSPDQDSSGRNSLGPHRSSKRSSMFRNRSERRRSAGDEDIWKQLNIVTQPNSMTNEKFSAKESVEKNVTIDVMPSGALETEERMPSTESEHKIPPCINPLSLEIMRLTSQYVSNTSIEKMTVSDNESISSKKSETVYGSDDMSLMCSGETVSVRSKRGKKEKIRHLFDVTMKKAKSIAQATHKEALIEIADEANPKGCEEQIKLKAAHSHKGPYEFQNTEFVQNLNDEHVGAVWCMKFSNCGRLLATAGQDGILRVWVIYEAFQYFQDMRNKYSSKTISPTPSQESLNSTSYHDAVVVAAAATAATVSDSTANSAAGSNLSDFVYSVDKKKTIFVPKPFCTYSGHSSDLLDVAWSKNYFILSSSMDKTVRLWHISRKECLCVFHHIDFVTAIAFLPTDDRYFLSGSLDGKLRLWDIPDKKVAVWNEVDGQSKLITAANFCENGKFAVVGTYDGRCIFYTTERLKYHTQIHVRSTRGRNATGRKISGIEPMPGEDKILVTSNDSRIRLYDLRDLNLSCKYKGAVNISSQIKACFSHDGKFIVCGSENRDIYIWKTHHDYSTFSSVRRDRNVYWEAIKAHHATVTCAIFAPNPDSILQMLQTTDDSSSHGHSSNTDHLEDPLLEQHRKGCGGHVLVSADFNGSIKVFVNRMKPKHSSLPLSALS